MSQPEELQEEPAQDRARFRRNLIKVMTVQVITLALLGYLQYLFTP